MHEGADRTDQGKPQLKELFLKKSLFEVTKPLPAFTNMNKLFIEKAEKRSLKSVTYPQAHQKKLTLKLTLRNLPLNYFVEEPEAKH